VWLGSREKLKSFADWFGSEMAWPGPECVSSVMCSSALALVRNRWKVQTMSVDVDHKPTLIGAADISSANVVHHGSICGGRGWGDGYLADFSMHSCLFLSLVSLYNHEFCIPHIQISYYLPIYPYALYP